LPDWVGKTSYRCYYTPDRDSYLPYWGWSIDSHKKFSQVPVSHDDFPPSPLVSLILVLNSTITKEHEVQSSLTISLCNDQELIPSTAYTEYCIHRVLHHPKIDCLPLPASLSSLSRPCCTQFSTFPHIYELTNE